MSGGTLPTVLVVDDEPFSVASMRMALEDDFNVLEATDAEAAWRLLEENWVQVVVSEGPCPSPQSRCSPRKRRCWRRKSSSWR